MTVIRRMRMSRKRRAVIWTSNQTTVLMMIEAGLLLYQASYSMSGFPR